MLHNRGRLIVAENPQPPSAVPATAMVDVDHDWKGELVYIYYILYKECTLYVVSYIRSAQCTCTVHVHVCIPICAYAI